MDWAKPCRFWKAVFNRCPAPQLYVGQDKKHGKEGFYRNTSTVRLDKGPQSTGETGERSWLVELISHCPVKGFGDSRRGNSHLAGYFCQWNSKILYQLMYCLCPNLRNAPSTTTHPQLMWIDIFFFAYLLNLRGWLTPWCPALYDNISSACLDLYRRTGYCKSGYSPRVISSAINSACFKTVSVAIFCISGG